MSPVAKPHWLTRARLQKISWAFLVFFMIFGGYFTQYMLLAPEAPRERSARDFVTFQAASTLAQQGEPAAVYDLARMKTVEAAIWPKTAAFPWFYPPTYLLAAYPLATLDYLPALAVFMVLGIGIFYIAARRWLTDSAAIFPILAFPAVLVNVMYCQNGLLTAGLVLLAFHQLERRPALAGLFIGLLAIKPHLGLLFPLALLLGGHRRAFAAATVTTLAFMLASLLCFGTETWQAFFASTNDARKALEHGIADWKRMITPFANVMMLGGSLTLAYTIQAAAALIFGAAMVLVWRSSHDLYLKGSVFVLATLNLSPYLFDYELAWLALPLILLTLRGLEQGWQVWEREMLLLVWLFPGIDMTIAMFDSNDITPNLAIIPEALLLYLVLGKWHAARRAA